MNAIRTHRAGTPPAPASGAGGAPGIPDAPRARLRRPARRVLAYALPGVWALAVLGWQRHAWAVLCLVPLLAATPVIACALTGSRTGVLLGGAYALAAVALLARAEVYEKPERWAGTVVGILVAATAGCFAAGQRARLKRRLLRARRAAAAAQETVLRPLPPVVGGLEVAATHLSATRGATLGGDLYDVVATPFGVRAVIGDVRGHGLPAVGTVASLLGVFREAAHDEPELSGVLRRLDRGLARHLRGRHPVGGELADAAEEFVTVLLIEVRDDGTATALNCGHPWPYRLRPAPDGTFRVQPSAETEPMAPLGMFPLPVPLPLPTPLRLLPGDALFLHTDGAVDARDAAGRYFPLARALTGTWPGTGRRGPGLAAGPRPRTAGTPVTPAVLVDSVRAGLLRHTRGRLADDAAVLVLRNARHPAAPATPAAPTATAGAQG
ncbi:PP2C family protein-serine/threonine phosphatase [Streptomyces sp. NPDC054784]